MTLIFALFQDAGADMNYRLISSFAGSYRQILLYKITIRNDHLI